MSFNNGSMALLKRLGACLLLGGSLLLGGPADDGRVEKAVAVDGRLWIKYQTFQGGEKHGGLFALGLADKRSSAQFRDGVVDVAKVDRQLWVLRRKAAGDTRLLLDLWQGGRLQFDDVADLRLDQSNKPVALVGNGGLPAVVCEHSIFRLTKDKRWDELRLSGQKLRSGVAISAASPQNGESLYVGFDVGEWGGGLQRIDWRTGRVVEVERRDSKKLCQGPLNRECDPVTGVIPDPLRQNCVLASVGLEHLVISNGRILRICGSEVMVVNEFLMPTNQGAAARAGWRQTEAVYGLVPGRDGGFWGVTRRAVYLLNSDGSKKAEYAMPKFEATAGNVRWSRTVPGVILLQTDMNMAVSVSGYTPLIVPLED